MVIQTEGAATEGRPAAEHQMNADPEMERGFTVVKLITSLLRIANTTKYNTDLLAWNQHRTQWRRLHNVRSYACPNRCDDNHQAESRSRCSLNRPAKSVHYLCGTCCGANALCVYNTVVTLTHVSSHSLWITSAKKTIFNLKDHLRCVLHLQSPVLS